MELIAMSEHDEFQSLKEGGSSTDEILRAMKDRGLTIIQAIKASMQLFGIGLGDAKSLVSCHPSWNPTAEAAQPFQDDLIKAFREAGSIGTQPE
jgi:ribosomal protein L7/L12